MPSSRQEDDAEAPVERSARLVILDREHRLLLFRYHDQYSPPFWATAGGRLLTGESYMDAAARELYEETGFSVPVGRLLRTREAVFAAAQSKRTRWIEHYFLVESAGGAPDLTNWTDEERATIQAHRWWSLAELRTTHETVLPEWLPELLEATLTDVTPM